jgi:hypothetical protein
VHAFDYGRNSHAKVLCKTQDLDNDNSSSVLLRLVMVHLNAIVSYNMLSNLVEKLREEELHPEDKLISFVPIDQHKGPIKHNGP